MRDPLAPVINGFDFSGIVNRYSLQCDQFYTEGDNGGTLLDGSTVTDALAAHVRLSWTLNSVSSAQYAAITAALGAGDSPDTVSAYVFDPSADAVRLAKFHVTRPAFNFAFDMNAGKMMSYAGGELVLEEASGVARFAVTPPTKTAYFAGEPLDLTGFSVTSFDNDGNSTDITGQCTTIPTDGTPLSSPDAAPVLVTVSLPVAPDVSVTLENICVSVDEPEPTPEIIAGGDWWTLYSNGLLEIFCNGDIPDAPWRDYRESVTRVSISDSVTSISDYAFSDCSALTSVTIPDSVTAIGMSAFFDCSALTSVTIPNSVTVIDVSAFSNCSALTSVTIPNSVEYIWDYAFSGCSGLTNISIPDSVGHIGEYAFMGCTSLTSVTIPDGVTVISSCSFYGCSSLSSVTLPRYLGLIEGSAFTDCSSITSIIIPNGAQLWDYAFAGCSALESVAFITSSYLAIGAYSFYGCSSLTDVYYGGTEETWDESINGGEIEEGNDHLISATIHYNSSGPT